MDADVAQLLKLVGPVIFDLKVKLTYSAFVFYEFEW